MRSIRNNWSQDLQTLQQYQAHPGHPTGKLWEMTPEGETIMVQNWSAPRNLVDPIELLFDNLEDCYVSLVCIRPAYTDGQIIDKYLTNVQRIGL